ncbi:MAG: hypothetical protein R6X11_07490 [Desulfonatronovibrio sp.]
MTDISSIDLKPILKARGNYCLSVYMPTTPVATDWNENSVRLKNLIRKAEKELEQQNADKTLIRNLSAPLWNLQEDTRFLQEMKNGAVFFSGPDFFEYYLFPVEVQEIAIASDLFYMKPLFNLFTYNTRYYLLVLSKHKIALYKADRFTIKEIEIPDSPKNLEDFLRFDEEQKQLQFHTRAPGHGNTRAAMFHGQGVGTDKKKEKEKSARYIQAAEQAVSDFLSKETLPLILTGDEHLQGIYRKHNSYKNMTDENITGNPDRLKPHELLNKGWEVASRIADQNIQKSVQEFHNEHSDNKTTGEIETVLPSAFYGKIDTLFISHEDLVWGDFKEETASVDQFDQWKPGAVELLDTALHFTLMNGNGKVYVLKKEHMPDHAKTGAVYRY